MAITQKQKFFSASMHKQITNIHICEHSMNYKPKIPV